MRGWVVGGGWWCIVLVLDGGRTLCFGGVGFLVVFFFGVVFPLVASCSLLFTPVDTFPFVFSCARSLCQTPVH